jgi:medium-chain acyl-[acyl-carrier-protein] hydrolase
MKMVETSTTIKKYMIELSDVDYKKQLKLSALFSYFQDISSIASDTLDLGINTIEEKYNVAWILIRIRVDVFRHPKWNEEITIETWPLEPKTLEFERDFVIRDSHGNVIIKAVSTWIILDIKSRRIKKSNTINPVYPDVRTDRAIECQLGKFKHKGELEIAYKKVIGYSDIDLNRHLNNSRYIDFIMDCFTLENHDQYCVDSIEVSFNNEALPGDTLALYKDISEVNEGIIYIEGINEKDLKTAFKAHVKVNKIN